MRLAPSIKRLFGWSPVRYASRVLVAQIGQSLRLQTVSLVSQALGILVVVFYFYRTLSHELVIGWAVAAVLALWGAVHFRRRFRSDCNREKHVRRWLRAWMLVAVVSGLVWGFAGSAFLAPKNPIDEVVIVTVIVAIVFASWPVFSCWLPSLTSFTLLALTPMFFGIAAAYGIGQVFTCLTLIVITSFVLYSGRRLNEIVVLSVIRNVQNERLVTRLKAEKALADSARRATAEATEMRTQFFAGANHDLRQPLQALGIYLQLLKGRLTGPDKEALEQIETCATAISTLVGQVLEVSRIESGQIAVTVERIHLTELFEDLAAEFSVLCENKGLAFRVVPLSVALDCDRTLLERILRNLLTNAVRYTKTTVSLVACDIGQGRIQIAVTDDGPGIDPAEKGRIFEAFFRGKKAKGKTQGYGLGLSIVKGLASRLSIPLRVESTVGKGSAFILTFLADPVAQGQGKTPHKVAGESLRPISGTVALLEDNEIVRTALEAVIKSLGATVISSAEPDSVFVERVIREAQAGTLTAIVSDFNLGDGFPNGLETIFLVATTVNKAVPSILLTAVSEEVIRAAYDKLDKKSFETTFPMPLLLQKPVTAKLLAAALQSAMDAGGR